jgi:hypothetical protein
MGKGRNVQYHSWLGKHKSKPQWNVTSHSWKDGYYLKKENNESWWGCGEVGTLVQYW